MKHLLYIFLFLGLALNAQIDIKDGIKYRVYDNDTIVSTHNTMANAVESFLNRKKNYPNSEPQILPYGKLDVVLSKDFFEGGQGEIIETNETVDIQAHVIKAVVVNTAPKRYFLISLDEGLNPIKINSDSLLNCLAAKEYNISDLNLKVKRSYLNGQLYKIEAIELNFQLFAFRLYDEQPEVGRYGQVLFNRPDVEFYRRMWVDGEVSPEFGEMLSNSPGKRSDGVWGHSQKFLPQDIGKDPNETGVKYNYQIKLVDSQGNVIHTPIYSFET